MKRLSLIFALSIVLLSFGLSSAFAQSVMTFDVQLGANSDFYHPIKDATFNKANANMQLDILIGNSGDAKNLAHQVVLQWYGELNGVPAEVPLIRIEQSPPFITYWKDGGFTEDHSWYMNPVDPLQYPKGALPNTDNYFATGLMGLLDTVVVRPGWGDGTLPDTFAYAGAGQTGLPIGGNLPRLHFFFSVPIANVDDVVKICVDSSGYPAETQYDWQFDNPSVFGGPYCFEFAKVPNLPPEAYGTPLNLSVEHHLAFSLHVDLRDTDDPTLDDITAVLAFDESGDPIGTITNFDGDKDTGSFDWTFNPPCSWVGESGHKVIFYAEDDTHGHTYPGVTGTEVALTATNSAPDIVQECPFATQILGQGVARTVNFTSTDANSAQDSETWTVTVDVTPDGPFGMVDGDLTFTPTGNDVGTVFTFTVKVTDCAGAFDECAVAYDVVASLPFEFGIEWEDGDNSNEPPHKDGAGTWDPDAYGDGHYLGQHAYVAVNFIQGSEILHGFDFLIAYDNSMLACMGAIGNAELFDIPGAYEWEYFTYRFGDNCGGGCPSGLLQIIGIADQNDGLHHPVGLQLNPMILFDIDFFVSNSYVSDCMFVPVYFYWTDCTDNSVAYEYTTSTVEYCIKQGIAADVYSFMGYDAITTLPVWMNIMRDGVGDLKTGVTFPTAYGPLACDNVIDNDNFDDPMAEVCELIPDYQGVQPAKMPVRFIKFYNGGIKIVCNEDIDDRGDLNLNGVSYEIADAVVFTNYFIYGLSTFSFGSRSGLHDSCNHR